MAFFYFMCRLDITALTVRTRQRPITLGVIMLILTHYKL